MKNFTQNPFFQIIILYIVSTFLWFLINDHDKKFKINTIEIMTDALYYFVFITLGLNILFNLKTVIAYPYKIILFSSKISWLASILTILLMSYRIIKYEKNANGYLIINYFLFLGFTNHLFYYFKYHSILSVLFIFSYFIIYFIHSKSNFSWMNQLTTGILTILHYIFMTLYSKIVIYYNLTFYRIQITSLFLIITIILFMYRSGLQSKMKLLD